MQLIRSNFGVRSGLRSQIGLGFTWTVDRRGLAQLRIGPGRAAHERRASTYGAFFYRQIYMVLIAGCLQGILLSCWWDLGVCPKRGVAHVFDAKAPFDKAFLMVLGVV
jgi:hypothetical protein